MKRYLSLLIAPLFFLACERNDDLEERQEIAAQNLEIAQDESLAQSIWDDVFKNVDEASRETSEVYKKSGFEELNGNCATLTLDNAQQVLTIDFGSSNCTGNDGRKRRGKIIATYTGRYRDSGTVITVTTDNFYLNDNKIEGIKTVTNLGRNSSGNLHYSINVQNGKITTAAGIIEYSSTRTREWVQGESTALNVWDDEYLISGTANGKTTSGYNYQISTLSPLEIQIGCYWIKSGRLEIAGDLGDPWNVDYGNGACDNKAQAEINGNTYDFVMR